MPQDDQTDQHGRAANHKDSRAAKFGLRLIVLAGSVFLTALLFVSIFHPNMSERVKFFTVTTLSLFVLVAVAVQAVIYRRQWGVMERQWIAMQRSLTQTDEMIEKMQGQLDVMREQSNASQITAKATEKSVQLAEQHAINTQRAYVLFRGAGITENRWDEIAVLVDIVNSGNTPASNVQIFANVDISDHVPILNVNSIAWERGGGVLAPKERMTKTLRIEPSEDQDNGRREETMYLYVWGAIRYKDIFDQNRCTTFCVFNEFPSTDFKNCSTGNQAD